MPNKCRECDKEGCFLPYYNKKYWCTPCLFEFARNKGSIAGRNRVRTTDNLFADDLELAEQWLEGYCGDSGVLANAVMEYYSGDRIVLDDDLPDATRDFVERSLEVDVSKYIKDLGLTLNTVN